MTRSFNPNDFCLLHFCSNAAFVLRRKLRQKLLVIFLLSVYFFHLGLDGLLKRDGQDFSRILQLSRRQREKELNISSRQRPRRQMIYNHCHKRQSNQIMPAGSEKNGIPRHVFSKVIVNDKYHFLYCKVPKVATSNWKRVFMVLDGKASNPWQIPSTDVHNKSRGDFRFLNEYSPSEIIVRLKTYYKFLFVRHPFERLASAYRNKFIEHYNLTLFTKIYGKYIIRKFRNRKDSEDTKIEISFPEFIRYVLEESDDVMNEHWRLYDDLCRPCLIGYDFIGHFEDLAHDSSSILRILNVSDKVSFPMNISSKYNVPSSLLTRKYFSKLPKSFKKRLYEKYKQDFEMFGYTLPVDYR